MADTVLEHPIKTVVAKFSWKSTCCHILYWRREQVWANDTCLMIQLLYLIMVMRAIIIISNLASHHMPDTVLSISHYFMKSSYNSLGQCYYPHFTDKEVVLVIKNLLANAGDLRDTSSLPGSGRSPGRGHSNPFQYSCLENPMDRGAWWATVHGVTKSQTWLKWLSMYTHCSEETKSFATV